MLHVNDMAKILSLQLKRVVCTLCLNAFTVRQILHMVLGKFNARMQDSAVAKRSKL